MAGYRIGEWLWNVGLMFVGLALAWAAARLDGKVPDWWMIAAVSALALYGVIAGALLMGHKARQQ